MLTPEPLVPISTATLVVCPLNSVEKGAELLRAKLLVNKAASTYADILVWTALVRKKFRI